MGREALIVAVDDYVDPGFGRLRAPAHDADALAEVLGDPKVGDFTVTVLRNADAQGIRVAVEDFFADRRPDDLLLLHFSCHGVKSASGELFLAAADSRPARLASTAVAADFVNRQMADCRAQRIALFLDCCYGGAFPRGMVMRGTSDVSVLDTFASQEQAGGRGRVVVTASSAVEYAFEGGELADDAQVAPSVFTGSVVEGLTSGEADRDGDGWVGLNELFGYVADRVRRTTPDQTPHLWAFGTEGDLLLARSRRRKVVATPLPAELVEGVRAPLAATRYGVAAELSDRLHGSDLGQALAAYRALTELTTDDSRRVSELAHEAVAAATPRLSPGEAVLDVDDPAAPAAVRLVGPPLALAANATTSAEWLVVEVLDDRVEVRATGVPALDATARITVTTPVGELQVPVRVGHPADVSAVEAPAAAAAPAPAAVAHLGPVATASDAATSAPGQQPERPERRERPSRLQRVVAVAVVAAGVLMALGYATFDPTEYLRMPAGYTNVDRAPLVDGYSTALLLLLGAAVTLWLRPRAAVAGGMVVGIGGWLALLAAAQLGQPDVTASYGDGKTWAGTLYLALLVTGLGVLVLATQGLLRGRFARRSPPQAERWLVVGGSVLMAASLALPFDGPPSVVHQSGLAVLVAVPATALALLVALTHLGRSRGDALVGATVAVLALDAVLLLLVVLNGHALFVAAALAGTLVFATELVLRRGPAPGA